MPHDTDRPWTTLWDRQNRRVLLLAGPKVGAHDQWGFVKHDPAASVHGVYDVWRHGEDVVFVEVRLDDTDKPLGFPRDLLDEGLLGPMTIWPCPDMPPFIWWHPRDRPDAQRLLDFKDSH